MERVGQERFFLINGWRRRIIPKLTDLDAKLADMDAAGISMAALSTSDPGPELFGGDGTAVAVMLNDYIADVAKRYPTRFFGLGVLPFETPDAMLKEFDRATGKLGMKGILLYSNLNGHFPDEQPYRPLFAEAERRGIPILLHPARPVTLEVTLDYDMSTMLGMMFDTTIALCRLILSGVLEQHPNLKLVCPHVGGALPYLIGRIDYQATVMRRGAERITRPPSQYLKQVWFDAVTQIPLAIRFAVEFNGVQKLMYSSDHPWVMPQAIIDSVDRAGLTPSESERVYSGTARELFGLSE